MFTCNRCGTQKLGTEITAKGRKGEVQIPKGWKMMFLVSKTGGTFGEPICEKCKVKQEN